MMTTRPTKFGRIDLFRLLSEMEAGIDVVSEVSDGPGAVLQRYGLRLPDGVIDFPKRLNAVLTRADLEDCARFEPSADYSNDEEEPFEFRLLAYGAKPAVVSLGTAAFVRHIGWKAQQYGYFVLAGPFAYQHRWDRGKGRYSNSMQRLGPGDAAEPGARRALVVARKDSDGALAWLALAFRWDGLLGRTLGYPPCCVAAFLTRWSEAERRFQGDLVPLVIEGSGSGPFSWHTNVLARYFHKSVLQHFPCHFACPASQDMAQAVYSCLYQREPQNAHSFLQVMGSPFIFTNSLGVFAFPGAEVDVNVTEWGMKYDPALMMYSTSDSELSELLRSVDTIAGHNDGGILRLDDQSGGYLVHFTGGCS
jgi:hypothetical protein